MDILPLLQSAPLEMCGEFLWGSNRAFLVQAGAVPAVYKPSLGARPLWDFEAGSLAHREAAAWLVSEALGWGLVPPTVYRMEAPLGPGSLQLFIQHDPARHYFTFSAADRQRLRPVVLFDLLLNNADRKGGHLLMASDGHLWCIDHGLCFHTKDKLRTVIWDFAGEPLPAALRASLKALIPRLEPAAPLYAALQAHLSPDELAALRRRTAALVTQERFPHPPEDRRPFPYPPV